MFKVHDRPSRTAAGLLLLATVTVLAGCKHELASFDDTYVPESVEETYPITVVERPVHLTVAATPGGLKPADVSAVTRFAGQAASTAATPVTVSYPSGSKLARGSANQAAQLLVRQGVPRHSIVVSARNGTENLVTLAFARKTAETKPCGDWSQNLRTDQFNGSGPNFGCAFQQNLAVMAANPEDFAAPRQMTPALSAVQNPAIDAYSDGTWTEPVASPSTTTTNP